MRNALAFILAGLMAASAAGAHAGPDNTVTALTVPDSLVSVSQAQAVKLAKATGGNVSQIFQHGSNNYAETDQTGAGNYAGIGQFGNDNYAKIVQNSVNAVAVYNQYGNDLSVTITQTGVNPPPVVVTEHR